MNSSPLSLERHIFRRVEVVAAEKPSPNCANLINVSLSFARNQEDNQRVLVGLDVRFLPPPEPDSRPAYTGRVTVDGYFRIGEPPWPDALLITNGAALLYGAIREMILNVTSRGPWTPLLLATVGFSQMAHNLVNQTDSTSLTQEPQEVAQTAGA